MARTRAEIDTTIRQRNPTIEVCDGECQTYTTGDAAYEAWIARTVDEHYAAALAVDEDDARKQLASVVVAYLDTLEANERLLVQGLAALKGTSPPATVAALRLYVTQLAEMTLDHNRGLARLIRLLVRSGIVAP